MSAMPAEEATRPYIVTFAGSICVPASDPAEAARRARAWAMRHVTEDAMIPDVEAGAPPAVLEAALSQPADCDEPGARLYTVPLAGTFNFIGPGIDAVVEKVRGKLERAAAERFPHDVRGFRYELRPGPPAADAGTL